MPASDSEDKQLEALAKCLGILSDLPHKDRLKVLEFLQMVLPNKSKSPSAEAPSSGGLSYKQKRRKEVDEKVIRWCLRSAEHHGYTTPYLVETENKLGPKAGQRYVTYGLRRGWLRKEGSNRQVKYYLTDEGVNVLAKQSS